MEVPEKIDSKFRFVLLAAQRAEQMVRGARSRLANPPKQHTMAAMQELHEERVQWGYGPAPAREPEPPPEA
jgi:DNA-directed RNA polymerase omega subunit